MPTPLDHLQPQDNNENDSSKEFTKEDKLKLAGALGVLAVGYVGVFGGYIETRSLGPGTGRAEFSITPKGHELIERTIGTMDSAADAVTGIFRTAPDENGESVEFTIEDDVPMPTEDAVQDFLRNGGITPAETPDPTE